MNGNIIADSKKLREDLDQLRTEFETLRKTVTEGQMRGGQTAVQQVPTHDAEVMDKLDRLKNAIQLIADGMQPHASMRVRAPLW